MFKLCLIFSCFFNIQSPTTPPLSWFYWGAEEGRRNALGKNQETPQEIPNTIQDVSAGSRHTFLVQTDGIVYAAGFVESELGYYGHLGLGPVKSAKKCKKPDTEFCVSAAGPADPLVVEKVVDAKGKLVNAPPFKRAFAGVGVPADSGGMHAVLISMDGKVYITGNNNKHQLCLGKKYDDVEFVEYFHEIPGISDVETVGVGDEFTVIRTSDNKVYGCGSNEVGQIGQGIDVETVNEPTEIKGMGEVHDMSVGLRFAIFLDSSEGEVWGTGSNIYGQQCFFDEGIPTNEVTKVRLSTPKRAMFLSTRFHGHWPCMTNISFRVLSD